MLSLCNDSSIWVCWVTSNAAANRIFQTKCSKLEHSTVHKNNVCIFCTCEKWDFLSTSFSLSSPCEGTWRLKGLKSWNDVSNKLLDRVKSMFKIFDGYLWVRIIARACFSHNAFKQMRTSRYIVYTCRVAGLVHNVFYHKELELQLRKSTEILWTCLQFSVQSTGKNIQTGLTANTDKLQSQSTARFDSQHYHGSSYYFLEFATNIIFPFHCTARTESNMSLTKPHDCFLFRVISTFGQEEEKSKQFSAGFGQHVVYMLDSLTVEFQFVTFGVKQLRAINAVNPL